MVNIPSTKLSSGVELPQLAYGSGTAWMGKKDDFSGPLDQSLIETTYKVLSLGYVHIDTAEVYKTEPEVGAGIKKFFENGGKREDIFVTTKLWPSVKEPIKTLKRSLEFLGLEYVDLYLLHCPFYEMLKDTPNDGGSIAETWRGLEEAKEQGLVKHIGVSNFRVSDLQELFKTAKVKPALNQVELHPYCYSQELLDFHKAHGIVTGAYAPLSPLVRFPGGPVDEIVDELAKKYGVSNALILLRWGIEQGFVVVFTTGKEERMREYGRVGEFRLTDEEVGRITEKGRGWFRRTFWKPQFGDSE